MSINSFLMSLVETKPLMIASLSGAGAVFFLGDNFDSALQFGAVGALGASLGDFIMNFAGMGTQVDTYLSAELAYMDPADGIGAALGSALLFYSLGSGGSDLLKQAALVGVAGLFAPKIAGLLSMGGPLKKLGPSMGQYGPGSTGPVNLPPNLQPPPMGTGPVMPPPGLIPKMGGPKSPPNIPVMGPFGPIGSGMFPGNPFLSQPPLEAMSVK